MWTIQKLVSKGDYLYAVVPEHPNKTSNNYVLHHRIVIETHLNRLLTSDEVVHHKNKNKKDNRIENLEVLLLKDHTRIHSSTGRAHLKLKCPQCNLIFMRAKNKTSYGKSNGILTFCSKNCSGRFYSLKENASLSAERIKHLQEVNMIEEFKLHNPI